MSNAPAILTAAPQQREILRQALADAGIEPERVQYVEAHGSGTPIGDRIELEALANAYAVAARTRRPLTVGSVKTNIGHTESASGAAGLIKVVLSLQHRELPQSLHFDNPSPHIPWGTLPVKVVDKSTPWEPNGRPRRAGVSSFGFTGTNAHVLIEEAPAAQPVIIDEQPADDVVATPESNGKEESISVLPLSARSPEALVELAQRYGSWLTNNPDADIAEVSRTAGVGVASRIALKMTAELSPRKGSTPVVISYSTAPNENKSLRASSSLARACSGDM